MEGVPDPVPLVSNDSASTTATDLVATSIAISPLDNDLDDELPYALSIASFTQPSGGTVIQNGNELIFTPTLGVFGPTSLDYTVTDGANFVSGEITITVNYAAGDIWLPFQECGGTTTFRANGESAGMVANSGVRTPGQHGYALSYNGSNSDFSLPGLTDLSLGDQPRSLMA